MHACIRTLALRLLVVLRVFKVQDTFVLLFIVRVRISVADVEIVNIRFCVSR